MTRAAKTPQFKNQTPAPRRWRRSITQISSSKFREAYCDHDMWPTTLSVHYLTLRYMRFFQTDARKFTERLPGTPDQVRNARLIIAKVLGDAHPCIDDAVLLATETATNAIRHTDSARPGGEFTLSVEHTRAWARVIIRDDGSARIPCLCPQPP